MKIFSGIIVVAGPTASGKTNLAIQLALEFDGELICSDSMQVFRKFDIGTSKPTLLEQQLVPHHQLDLIDPNENYSAGKYEHDTSLIIKQIQQRGHLPILVGGTGLYYRALMYGISNIPDIPHSIHQDILNLQEKHGTPYCWEQLKKIDPKTANRLHANDKSRIMRSLEVFLSTGISIVDFQERQPFNKARYPALVIAYHWERDMLYDRINQRTQKMLESGWIKETQELLESYSSDLKPFQSIGYREIVKFLRNDLECEQMVIEIQQRTRQFAKRQMTWFKKESKVEWHQSGDEKAIFDKIKVFLEK